MEEIHHNGDIIYLKKSKFSENYRVVHPVKVNGKINWRNLIAGGSWFNLVYISILVLFILLAVSEYSSAVKIAQECLDKLNVGVNVWKPSI